MSPYWSSSVELAPPEESYLENEGDDRQEDEEGVREDLHLEQEPLAIVHWNLPEFDIGARNQEGAREKLLIHSWYLLQHRLGDFGLYW